MVKVQTEMEALELCKQYFCEIRFYRQTTDRRTPEHVIVSLNPWTEIVGKDLVEAVNRLSDVYHTAPHNYPNLPWWKEHQNFYITDFRKNLK